MASPKTAVLLINLGTPEAPTAKAVKPYLKEFLSDPRIIEVNPTLWKIVLNCMILPRRSPKSAKKYEKVWMKEGSPLIVHTRSLAEKLQKKLDPSKEEILVTFAMRYGKPSVKEILPKIHSEGAEKVLLVPMYPQYSATTTGTAMDIVCDTLKTMRSQPEIRNVRDWHDHPNYIKSIADSIRLLWKRKGPLGEKGKLILSYHGMPQSYCRKGDPYKKQVEKTSSLIEKELKLKPGQLLTTYQSKFGNDLWLEPSTEITLRGLPPQGVERVDILCPGFSADCLETLEEINMDCRKAFLTSGGKEFNYIRCLNADDGWVIT
ncbi:MAG: ferrochelatase, partial [Burkholderiales bacterium]|nr:ferrochelatase [Burkholderiales bacterium]